MVKSKYRTEGQKDKGQKEMLNIRTEGHKDRGQRRNEGLCMIVDR